MRRRIMSLLPVVMVAMLVLTAAPAQARQDEWRPRPPQRRVLRAYAADTWKSFVAMASPIGLPTDNIDAGGVRARYTSPTNIGAYMWSTVVARDLGFITIREAHDRIAQTLETLETLERDQQSGQFYNWYDPDTGAKLTTWPTNGSPVYPFLSSVDNGWLATALMIVRSGVPSLRDEAAALLDSMNFGFYYDPGAGLLRGGYWPSPPPGGCHANGFTCHHYGALNTEPRIASYIAIARGQVPATHYFKMWRTFPPTCDWSWQEMQPEGVTRTYLGVEVFEGHYTYRGMNIVPSWGGSMFEALMVPLFVPEEQWGARSWGVNHPLYVQAQIEHGLEEAQYGYWGFSPSNDPAGGYREYGVDPIGLDGAGYTSDEERTTVDYGFGDCRPAQPPPASYGQGVVTPHASFLALEFAPEAALENLANLRADFDAYGTGGFYDAVNVVNGQVSHYYLALDQGMIMASLGNALRANHLQRYFTRGEVEEVIAPMLAMEEFTAGN